jgi:hypothetical protein
MAALAALVLFAGGTFARLAERHVSMVSMVSMVKAWANE